MIKQILRKLIYREKVQERNILHIVSGGGQQLETM